jgi:adenylylsulfate kinase-like enzyme
MYAKARGGLIPDFTGVYDTYERPRSPEIKLNTEEQTAKENARSIVEYLRAHGFLAPLALGAKGC